MSDADLRRAFDAATRRFCEARTADEQSDEATNMLGHLFMLTEARRGRFDTGVARLEAEGSAPTALAVALFRHKHVHESAEVVELGDVFGRFMTNLFGQLVWVAAPEVVNDSRGRYERYGTASIVGHPVLDTLVDAFAEVEALP